MERYIKLMADYCSDGVWNDRGSMMDRDSLPISQALKDAISAWCGLYENSEFYLSPHERHAVFDVGTFNACGENLAALLRLELPDWTIEYRPE